MAQCDARGIPPEEVESVVAFINKRFGKSLKQMNVVELKKVNSSLEEIMVDYLGGVRRRGETPIGAW
jgi:hypothetical protein